MAGKRVRAIRRASDGSAFQKCNFCGVSVAVALADMHDCESKKDAKRCKGECTNRNDVKPRLEDQPRLCVNRNDVKPRLEDQPRLCVNQNDVKLRLEDQPRSPLRLEDQPRSPFRLFMETFLKSCEARNPTEVDRKGFETWINMSKEERLPYVLQAEKVDSVYTRGLLQEVEGIASADDEADSAEVGTLPYIIMKKTRKTQMATKGTCLEAVRPTSCTAIPSRGCENSQLQIDFGANNQKASQSGYCKATGV